MSLLLALTGDGSTVVNTNKGSLVLTGFTPIIQTPVNVNSGVGALSITGFSPTILLPDIDIIGTGQLILEGFEPTINIADSTVRTNTGQLSITGYRAFAIISNPDPNNGGGGGWAGLGLRNLDTGNVDNTRERILAEDKELLLIVQSFLECQE